MRIKRREKVMIGILLLVLIISALYLLLPVGAHASSPWFGPLECVNWHGCTARSRITGRAARGVERITNGAQVTGIAPIHRLRHLFRRDQWLVRLQGRGYWYDTYDLRAAR